MMNQPVAPYVRLVDAGLGAWRLSCHVAETLVAAQTVINSRLALIGAGLIDPRAMPWPEIERMITEKPATFARAGSGAMRKLAPASRRTSGWNALPGALADDVMTSFALLDRTIAASLAWWKPVGAKTRANARRLRR
ncbi:hypothetical protein [Flavisphingomonas formosensis]|uniref:hypothetical protein n=1 Tax=Flavisphingomonas formosensis TaxID=861534 RepID=UPI0012FCF2FA|nr:hypothetical protein [Sphingomonas formosensis]